MEALPFFRVLRDILFIEKETIQWTSNGQSIIIPDEMRAQQNVFPTYFRYVL